MIKYCFFYAFIFISLTNLYSQVSVDAMPPTNSSENIRYPLIRRMTNSDPVFLQYIQEVEENYKSIARQRNVATYLYSYVATQTDDLLSIAARCNIPYESIALINSIAYVDSAIAGQTLLLPTNPALFIAEFPKTPLEFLLKTRYANNSGYEQFSVGDESYTLIPNARLTPTERAFFTDSAMIAPLALGVISSSFGMRISPFTGEQSFHRGTDIAAPIGTPVFASKSGVVAYAGRYHPVYGNYIILQHDNNMQSLYAHLDDLHVETGEIVEKGSNIGTVGSTGMSTGPHLHFEILIGNRAQNPEALIRNFIQ